MPSSTNRQGSPFAQLENFAFRRPALAGLIFAML